MGKKSKRKTRWRTLPIDVSSQNDEDCDDEVEASTNPEIQHNGHFRKFRPNNGYRYHSSQRYSSNQTSQHNGEKKMFNEDEYTKITTPRQDVLFKKGYLGRRRPVVTPVSTPGTPLGDSENATENGECQDNQSEASSETVTSQDQPASIIYTNGYVDPHGGPIFYLNGTYDMYEPYSGMYSSFMIPASPNGMPGSVLTAVPCQQLPLQPLEWFNPRGPPADMGGWCLVAPACPAPPPMPPQQHRRKRYSTDSQNCSPHSSESTGPPGSPQHEEEEILTDHMSMNPADLYSQQPAYVYPGYMFGPAVYNVNGVGVPGPPPPPVQSNGISPEHVNGNGVVLAPSTNGVPPPDPAAVSAAAQAKRRKKKRRRKRRRGFRGEGAGTDDGSEESTSEDALEDVTTEEVIVSPRSAVTTTNNCCVDNMNQSSPGDVSVPPATTSESCSELSSPQTSHDETELPSLQPVRPSRKHTPHHNQIESKVESKIESTDQIETVIESEIKTANEEIISHAHENGHTNDTTITIQQNQQIQDETCIVALQMPLEEATAIVEDILISEPIEQQQTPSPKQKNKNIKISTRKNSKKASAKQQKQNSSTENIIVPEINIDTQFEISPPVNIRETEETERISPIPPPRSRRGGNKSRHRPPTPCNLPPSEQETLARDLSEQIITDAIDDAIRQYSRSSPTSEIEVSCSRPITEAVTTWLQTNPTDPLINLDELSEDEEENVDNLTGSKNGIVNPLPAPSNNRINNNCVVVSTDGPEKRVENIIRRKNSLSSNISSCSGGEWDNWDDLNHPKNDDKALLIHENKEEVEETDTLIYSDPIESVAKYYQLTHHDTNNVIKLKPSEAWISVNDVISDSGIESGDEPISVSQNTPASSVKFVRHLQHGIGGFPDTEPFPCGACCTIQ